MLFPPFLSFWLAFGAGSAGRGGPRGHSGRGLVYPEIGAGVYVNVEPPISLPLPFVDDLKSLSFPGPFLFALPTPMGRGGTSLGDGRFSGAPAARVAGCRHPTSDQLLCCQNGGALCALVGVKLSP